MNTAQQIDRDEWIDNKAASLWDDEDAVHDALAGLMPTERLVTLVTDLPVTNADPVLTELLKEIRKSMEPAIGAMVDDATKARDAGEHRFYDLPF